MRAGVLSQKQMGSLRAEEMAALPLPAIPLGQHLAGCEERVAWSREALSGLAFSLASGMTVTSGTGPSAPSPAGVEAEQLQGSDLAGGTPGVSLWGPAFVILK